MKDYPLTWAVHGSLLDYIEVLECREEQYQKLIHLGITLITVKNDLLEWHRAERVRLHTQALAAEQEVMDLYAQGKGVDL